MTYRKLYRYWFEVKSIDAVGNVQDGWEYNEQRHVGFIYSTASTAQVVGRAVTALMRSIHGEDTIPKGWRKKHWAWVLDRDNDTWELVHTKTGKPSYCLEQVSEPYVLLYRGEITTDEYNKRLGV